MLLAGGLWLSWGRPRTDRVRAAHLLWGGWLLVTALVFSFMQGIFHAYYTVALAPAVAALVGMGAVGLWERRSALVARLLLAAALAVTAVWSWRLLERSASWNGWLGTVVLVGGLAAAFALLTSARTSTRVSAVVAAAGVVVALVGPAAYALQTAATPHTGAIVTAGPTVVGTHGGPGGQLRPGLGAMGRPQGGFPGAQRPGGAIGGAPGGPARGTQGGMGGLLEGSTASAELVALLQADASSYRWVAATVGANNAAGYQLASEHPVMPIGGFNGSDPVADP